jgi:hypothetical protein
VGDSGRRRERREKGNVEGGGKCKKGEDGRNEKVEGARERERDLVGGGGVDEVGKEERGRQWREVGNRRKGDCGRRGGK